MKSIVFSQDQIKEKQGCNIQIRHVVNYKFIWGYNPEWTGYNGIYEHGKFFLEGSRNRAATTKVKPKYQLGEFVYVKETWCELVREHIVGGDKYVHKANTGPDGERIRQEYIKCGLPYQWKSSIHMPYSAARIFLQVKAIRVERLQDISEEDAKSECSKNIKWYEPKQSQTFKDAFALIWDRTVKKENQKWKSNPWVWIYEFERVTKEGAGL